MTSRESDKRLADEINQEIRENRGFFKIEELTSDIEDLRKERDALKAERDKLKKILARELTENDELGSEFVYVQELKRLLAESKARARILREALKEAYTALVGGSERGGVFWRENAFQDIYKVLNDDQVLQRPESSC